MSVFSEIIIGLTAPSLLAVVIFFVSNKSKSRKYYEERFKEDALVSKVSLSYFDQVICVNVDFKNFEKGFVFGRHKYFNNQLTHIGSEKVFFRTDHYFAYIDLDTINILTGETDGLIYAKDLKYCGVMKYFNYYMGKSLTPSKGLGEYNWWAFYVLYGSILLFIFISVLKTKIGLDLIVLLSS